MRHMSYDVMQSTAASSTWQLTDLQHSTGRREVPDRRLQRLKVFIGTLTGIREDSVWWWHL